MNQYELYDSYLKTIRTYDYTSVTKLEWLNPDGTPAFTLETDAIQDGTLNVAYQNGTRRTANLELENWHNTYDVNIDKIQIGSRIKLSKGVMLPQKIPYYLPQGIFYISNPDQVYEPNNRKTRFELVDKWAWLNGTLSGKIPGIYQISVGDDLHIAAQQILLTDRGNGTVFDSVPLIFSSYYKDKLVTITGNSQVLAIEVITRPISSGNITVVFENGSTISQTVAVLNTDTAQNVATKIAAAFTGTSGWTITADNRAVIFTSTAFAEVTSAKVTVTDTGSTGVGTLNSTERRVGVATHDVPITDCPYTSRKEGGQSYADVLLEINTMLVGTIGYDALGRLQISSVQEDILDNRRPIMWDFSDREPELLGLTYQVKTSDVYNHVVIHGGTINGHQAKGLASNADISSSTCIQRIGMQTYFESMDKLFSDTLCQEYAEHILRKMKYLQKAATFRCTPMYHFQEHNLVSNIISSKSNKPELYLVDRFTLPLGNKGEMTFEAVNVQDIL